MKLEGKSRASAILIALSDGKTHCIKNILHIIYFQKNFAEIRDALKQIHTDIANIPKEHKGNEDEAINEYLMAKYTDLWTYLCKGREFIVQDDQNGEKKKNPKTFYRLNQDKASDILDFLQEMKIIIPMMKSKFIDTILSGIKSFYDEIFELNSRECPQLPDESTNESLDSENLEIRKHINEFGEKQNFCIDNVIKIIAASPSALTCFLKFQIENAIHVQNANSILESIRKYNLSLNLDDLEALAMNYKTETKENFNNLADNLEKTHRDIIETLNKTLGREIKGVVDNYDPFEMIKDLFALLETPLEDREREWKQARLGKTTQVDYTWEQEYQARLGDYSDGLILSEFKAYIQAKRFWLYFDVGIYLFQMQIELSNMNWFKIYRVVKILFLSDMLSGNLSLDSIINGRDYIAKMTLDIRIKWGKLELLEIEPEIDPLDYFGVLRRY